MLCLSFFACCSAKGHLAILLTRSVAFLASFLKCCIFHSSLSFPSSTPVRLTSCDHATYVIEILARSRSWRARVSHLSFHPFLPGPGSSFPPSSHFSSLSFSTSLSFNLSFPLSPSHIYHWPSDAWQGVLLSLISSS